MRGYVMLESYIANVVSRCQITDPTHEALSGLRSALRLAVNTAFNGRKRRLSPEAVSWVADWYFKRTPIVDGRLVADVVVINEVGPGGLPQKDIDAIRAVYRGTDLARLIDAGDSGVGRKDE